MGKGELEREREINETGKGRDKRDGKGRVGEREREINETGKGERERER